ncbi:ribbon-helix-helix protein, CopG family (plasmid) [Halorubrum sp. BOL3-1]|uniref:ribbon-helix-helix protein, CopG family n=1 Tax=Halorubrum sp. BOL3-1 TaxID=2497325 RepID=UPI001005060F|nr:ribbon-helix-helix protein, CopG family [Halorubrum sp. BOL3-1]QAU11354.1 ribbon-helix-helix protein, CopG family [Halorubrum sp. BOL3-1]
MEQITLRLPEDLKEELEKEAEEHSVSRSEHIRNVLESRENTDRLRSRIETLEEQLRERSRVEEKIEDLPDKLRDAETYIERRQRKLDRTGLAQRVKWKMTGVPVNKETVEE